MREILFRGKRLDNDEWIYGSYNHLNTGKDYICDGNYWLGTIEVDPETVGQWTGLVDVNRVKIFEGDIFNIEDDIIGTVVFKDGCFRIEEYGICGTWTENGFDECGGGTGILQCEPIDWYRTSDMKVIGNIHDKAVE